ncbi:MAG TPA: glycosyltransferase family 4 protein, partial [Chthoniobacterales bacterium]|nr:glycosyltransferase family 4 protein [Chthoniobacterales bacterium]
MNRKRFLDFARNDKIGYTQVGGSNLTITFVRRGYSVSGGAEAYLKRLAHGMVNLRHNIELITSEDWPKSEWPSGQITRLRARSAADFADQVEQERAQRAGTLLFSLERIWRCDIFRAGDGVHRAWLNRRKKFELPLQRFARGLSSKHQQLLQLEAALFAKGGAARTIVASEMVKNEIVDLYGYSADKIDIIRNGVPVERFRFDPELRERSRANLKLQRDHIALLFVGSGWERKGLLFAMEAMAMCRDRRMRLLVAGRGKTQRYYKSKHVRFLGEVVDLLPIYAAADIFILPTIYDPFSNACLEALACGLPVITTRSNGFSEIIDHQVHGSIVDAPNDITALADMLKFWSDETRR